MKSAISRLARKQVMDVPALYRIWFEIYRRHINKTVKLPTRGDALYLDGFPRSGNTYFSAAVHSMFPALEFSNHLHCLAPLRIALSNRVPSFVLMRIPVEAIASRFLQIRASPGRMQSLATDELLLRLVGDWKRYYSFCEQNLKNLQLITFEDAVGNPHGCLMRIGEIAGLDINHCDEESFQEFHGRFRENDRTKSQGSTSFPDAQRNKEKEALVPLIERSTDYGDARSIYSRLRNQAVVIQR